MMPMDERCPHLGVLSADNRREPPVEFPSLENQCLASGAGDLILLGDQATYCLGREHRTCPRFRRAKEEVFPTATGSAFVPFYENAEEAWAGSAPLEEDTAFVPLLGAPEETEAGSRRRWAWLGAGLVFASVFLCGSMVATYTGWEWISRNAPARTATGRVETVAAADEPTALPYVVVTATPLGGPQPSGENPPPTVPLVVLAPGEEPGSAAPGFPAAVTPTPIVIDPLALAPAATGDAVAGEALGEAPAIDVQLAVPTRRPTPIFDLPTSTALPELPTPTPSETPVPLGTPIIVFAPDDGALKEGRCTFVRWNVKNVREVYYENLPMSGQGEREECIEDEPKIFRLLVVLGDGSTQTYTTTVGYLPPTPTPTVTPSFTPEPELTPTWTPIPPTPTPMPNITYGVVLAPSGSTTITCERGQSCDVGLLLTNSGDTADTLALLLVQGGALPAQLCRPDGVCAGNDLQVAGVGPGNTAYVLLRVSTPGDAAAQSTSYVVQGASTGSGRSVTSQAVTIQVTVP